MTYYIVDAAGMPVAFPFGSEREAVVWQQYHQTGGTVTQMSDEFVTETFIPQLRQRLNLDKPSVLAKKIKRNDFKSRHYRNKAFAESLPDKLSIERAEDTNTSILRIWATQRGLRGVRTVKKPELIDRLVKRGDVVEFTPNVFWG